MTCIVCGKRAYSEYCVQHKPRKPIKVTAALPRPTKPIPKAGSQHKKWAKYRQAWKKKHIDEPKHCHICGKYLAEGTFTLDHVIPRSRRPDLVFDDSNIKPACWTCNSEKASRVL